MTENTNENTTEISPMSLWFTLSIIYLFIALATWGAYTGTKHNKVKYVITNPDGIIGQVSVILRQGTLNGAKCYDRVDRIREKSIIYPKPEDMEPKRKITRDVITIRIPGQMFLRTSGVFNPGTMFTIFLNGTQIYQSSTVGKDLNLNFSYERIILEKGKNHWVN